MSTAAEPGVAAFLRNVPVLAALGEEDLGELAGRVRHARIAAGQWLMRRGEDADCLYIVRTGRLEVIDEGPQEVLVRLLRRGDVIGELALLRRGTRSASVRARRDSDLLRLHRDDFEQLIATAPGFALGLTRAMGAQLAASRMPVAASAPPRTVAIVELDGGGQAPAVGEGLAAELARHGSVAVLSDGSLETIDAAERERDRVLLLADAGSEAWRDLCMTEAHMVLAVTRGGISGPLRADALALGGCELLVLGARADPEVIDLLAPRECQVAPGTARRADALAATARRIAARSPGLVLSGGGAAAFAHLGVIEELTAAGVRFDRVAGVSMGALVAAGVALEYTPERLYEDFDRQFVKSNPANDFTVPAYSLVRGGKTRRLLAEAAGDIRIEELPLRYFCISCDLVSRDAVVHRSGLLREALYATMAIPGVFPPLPTPDGRLLVDGGVLDNLPVAAMARAGEGPIVAVDVTSGLGRLRGPESGPLEPVWRPIRRALTGNEFATPHLGATIVRSIIAGRDDTVAAARMHADLVVTPGVEGIAPMDWKSLPRVVELGRRAARAAIEQSPEALAALTA